MTIFGDTWWTCVTGAMKFLSGPRRTPENQVEVASKCAACPSMRLYREHELHGTCGHLVRWFMPDHSPITGWCGEPGEKSNKTCGCLVLAEAGKGVEATVIVTIKGQQHGMIPAGKTTVATEHCPQGRF